MEFITLESPNDLKEIVQYVWSFRAPDSLGPIWTHTFVDLFGGIIFQHKNGSSAIVSNNKLLPEGMIHGLMRSPASSLCATGFSAFGIRLQPDAIHRLFGINAYHLTDNIFPIDHVIQTGDLKDIVLNSSDFGQQAEAAFDFLRSFKVVKRRSSLFVQDCIEYIQAQPGTCTVQQVRAYFKVSERKLQRDFLNATGVSPRHFIQVTRFMEIVKRLRTHPDDDLLELAFDLDFTDQPHLSNAIKKFSMFPPRRLAEHLQKGVLNLVMREASSVASD